MNSMRALLVTLLILFSYLVHGQKLEEWFIDSVDNALDVSNFLATRAGFLPVPMFITEPAVGYGLGMGLIFFHRTKEERETGQFRPMPIGMSVLGGLVTENGTWGALAAHQGSWRADKLRYVGALGWVNVNMTYYKYLEFLNRELSVGFNVNGFLFYQELITRLASTNLFVGGQYVYFKNDATLDFPSVIFPDGVQKEYTTGGLGGQLVWDSRDNIFTTNEGVRAELNYLHFAPYFGGENEYSIVKSRNIFYNRIGRNTNLGFKAEGQFSFGDIPFYGKPYVTLRGVPTMRYQSDMAWVTDVELRQRVYKRWSLIGFWGAGAAVPYENWKDNIDFKTSIGGGFRYFMARMYNMHAGVDVAKGPEDWAWYIIVGTYWGR